MISLTWERNWDLRTIPEKQGCIRGEKLGIAIRELSGIAAHGLLLCARCLYIHLDRNFTPGHFRPFNNDFQHFDRTQEMSIYWLYTLDFLEDFNAYFANFVPTLRPLYLDTPTGNTQDILGFVYRFPHLDDLTSRVSNRLSTSTPIPWNLSQLPGRNFASVDPRPNTTVILRKF